MSRKLFCEYGPLAYKISLFKEAKKKDLIDFKNGKKFAEVNILAKFEFKFQILFLLLFQKANR